MIVETNHETELPTVNVIQVCPCCDKPSHLNAVPAEGFAQWQHGTPIQRALPDLSDDDREILMTGYHPRCWDEDVPEDE